MALNLFPARASMGRVSGVDVYMTPEFARALSSLLERIGGPDGLSIGELQKELARRPSTLAQASDPIRHAGGTDPKTLAVVKVPANSMGKAGMLRITTVWSMTNSENEKTVSVKFGGSEISSNAVTTVTTYQEQRTIQNRTKTAQVFVHGGNSFTGQPIATLDKNTTLPQDIEIVAQLANPDESMTLEAYTVELIPTP